AHVDLAAEGQDVVLAPAVEVDVFDHHHLVVLLFEHRIGDHVLGLDAIPVGELAQRAGDTVGRGFEPRPDGVFTEPHQAGLEMAEGAQAIGYEYLGITDHSPRITVVHGLDAERLVAQSREMAEVQKAVDVKLLQGIEVDILEDGSLDLPDAVLEILDVVIASPHVKLRQEPAAMTERMLRAASHPHVDVIGHPTGRRPGSREGASYDFEAVFKEAAKHGIALEIDCDPARMDLSPEMARLAYECGCSFAVDADAHAPAEFAYVPMALWMARRAGIPQDRILNFRPLDELTMAR